MDEVQWVVDASALMCLQYFDTVGSATGRASVANVP